MNNVNIINCFSFAFTYVILSLTFYNFSKISCIKLFLFCFFSELIFVFIDWQSFSTLPIALCAAYILKQDIQPIKALFITMSTTILMTIFVFAVGSFIRIFNIVSIKYYNYFMSIIFIFYGMITYFVICQIKNKFEIKNKTFKIDLRFLKYLLIFEVLILFIISFAIPMILLAKEKNKIFIFYFLCSILMMIISLLLIFIYYIHINKTILEEKNQLYKLSKQLILKEYDTAIRIKHYYNKLYYSLLPFILKRDIESIEKYFREYITPVQMNHAPDAEDTKISLEKIQNILIRNLINMELIKSQYNDTYKINLIVLGEIEIKAVKDIDIFKILTIFIDNAIEAVEEIENQETSIISISFVQENNKLFIKIKNDITGEINISKIYYKAYTTKENHNGYGLSYALDIIESYENLEHMNYIEFHEFIQVLVITQ